MLSEKLKKIVNHKYFEVLLIFIINITIFILCNKLFNLRYEQVDDFMIMNLISKMDGKYSVYGVQMHPIICGIIILLYKTAININWYTIFLFTMQFVSFTIIGIVFMKRNKVFGILAYIPFILIMYSKMLSYIQYTTVSMLCITSGFILFMYSLEDIKNVNKHCTILSLIMILIGCMIRFSTIIIALPFMIIYLICKLFRERDFKILKILLLFVISVLLVNVSFNIFYNINPTYKEFLKFHDVRTYLHDYNWMYYEENKETFDSVNWSENDRDIFCGYCFGDEEFFSVENLNKLRDSAVRNEKNDNLFIRCYNTIKSFVTSVEDDIYKYVFATTIILVITNNLFILLNSLKYRKNNKIAFIKVIFINLIFLSIIGMHCLFIFLSRPMFRVVISIYIVGISILIYELLGEANNKEIINYILIIFIIPIGVLEFKQNIRFQQYYDISDYSIYREVLEYTNSHKENAYIYTLSMQYTFLSYSVYEKVPNDTFSNLRSLGNWDTYTENYYNFKERYDIDNLMQDLYKKENVYLIAGNVIWGEEYGDYLNIIKKYIQEHYKINVEVDVVKEFGNNIKIYKLYE